MGLDIKNDNVNGVIGAGIKSTFAVMVRADSADKCWFRAKACWCNSCIRFDFANCTHKEEAGEWQEKRMKQVPVETKALVSNVMKDRAGQFNRIIANSQMKKFPTASTPFLVAIINENELVEDMGHGEYLIGVLNKRPRKVKEEDYKTQEEEIRTGLVFDIVEDDWVAEVIFLKPSDNLRLEASPSAAVTDVVYVIPDNAKPMLIPLSLIVDPSLWVAEGHTFPRVTANSKKIDNRTRIFYTLNGEDYNKLQNHQLVDESEA
jgi:hypothetical protein